MVIPWAGVSVSSIYQLKTVWGGATCCAVVPGRTTIEGLYRFLAALAVAGFAGLGPQADAAAPTKVPLRDRPLLPAPRLAAIAHRYRPRPTRPKPIRSPPPGRALRRRCQHRPPPPISPRSRRRSGSRAAQFEPCHRGAGHHHGSRRASSSVGDLRGDNNDAGFSAMPPSSPPILAGNMGVLRRRAEAMLWTENANPGPVAYLGKSRRCRPRAVPLARAMVAQERAPARRRGARRLAK
jgi:hypothetical protein